MNILSQIANDPNVAPELAAALGAPHTSGPWRVGLPADGGRINVYSDDSMAMRICRVDSNLDFGNNAAANARLIAAAPELLAALRAAIDLMEQENFSTLRLVPKLRVAIAKATGESA